MRPACVRSDQFWQLPSVHAAFTTSVVVAVLLRPPLVPVTVSTLLPVAAVAVVAIVSVELLAVAGLGLKVPVCPVPRPLTLNVTAPVKLVRVMFTV
jgi:Na+-transporting NADH:ubiquinone oxidoreductase subunit NqrB